MLATVISGNSCENSSLELDQPPSQDPRFRCFAFELLGAANCFVELCLSSHFHLTNDHQTLDDVSEAF